MWHISVKCIALALACVSQHAAPDTRGFETKRACDDAALVLAKKWGADDFTFRCVKG